MIGIKIPWQVWACAGLVIFQCLFGWYWYEKGSDSVQERWDASVARGTVIVENLKAGQNKVTTVVETKYVDRVKVVYEKGKTITKLVPQFIPDGTCDLPGGFRVLHDAAITGSIPTAADGTNGQPVSVETATTTVTENYTTCQAAITDLEGLREWVRQQRELYLEQCKLQGVDCSKDN